MADSPLFENRGQGMRLQVTASKLASKVIEQLANFAIFIDAMVVEIGRRAFSILPDKVQDKLRSLNETYKSHRNKLLGIENWHDPTLKRTNPKESGLGDSQENCIHSEICDIDSERALQRGDVPGWVLVVLMTTGLVTALWTIAAPRLSQILKNSLDSMNSVR